MKRHRITYQSIIGIRDSAEVEMDEHSLRVLSKKYSWPMAVAVDPVEVYPGFFRPLQLALNGYRSMDYEET